MVKLGDICTIYSGTGFPVKHQGYLKGKYPFYKVGDIAKNVLQGFVSLSVCDNYIDEAICQEIKGTIIPQNTVVFAKIGEAVKLNRRAITSQPCLIDNNAMGIKPNENIIDLRYFYHFMCNLKLEEYAEATTVPSVKKSVIEKIEIPLPPLETQKQIAANLDKVTHTIDLCNNILEKLDLLVKARFVEMFGNFVLEKERWKKCCVGDVAGTVDPQPSHRTPPIDVDGIPYIGIAECNYQSRKIDFESARKVGKKVLEEHIARYELHNGDFIIGKIGTIGKPFFIPSERFYTLSANTVLIQPNSEMIAPQFLFSIFQSEYMDRIIDAEKKSTSQPAFGIQKVRAIEIPLPPIDLQNQFAAFVEQTDKSKLAVKQVLEKAETLKKALMQEYFG